MTQQANNAAPEVLPGWYSELREQWQVGTRLFLLDFNVRDLVFAPHQPLLPPSTSEADAFLKRVPDWLCSYWLKKFDIVLTYSLTTGLRLYTHENEVLALSFDTVIRPADIIKAIREGRSVADRVYREMADYAVDHPFPISDLFSNNPNADSIRHTLNTVHTMQFLDRLLTLRFGLDAGETAGNSKPVRVALLIDHLEHLAPDTASQGAGARDLTMMTEMLNRWALDDHIRENKHLVVMLAEDIHLVSSSLHEGSGTHRIRLGRPSREERQRFITWLESSERLTRSEANYGLAGLTAGFNFAEINSLVSYAQKHQAGLIQEEEIRKRKANIIKAESRELLEVVEPSFGWEQVGGLKHVVSALTNVATWLREQPDLVPKGMLFVGPPGTGKSFVAQALAKEGKVNLVKLKNVQSMYVGESERNMTRALEVAQAFEPVIIFVDEIDQAYGQRSTHQGDSGVTARIFGKILEFTGDNSNRSRVMWIAASNRPDMIDAALLRRFDRVIPFLLPSRRERYDLLLNSMPKIAKFRWVGGENDAKWPNEEKEAFERVLDRTDEFSGSELEKVVRRGLELSNEGAVRKAGSSLTLTVDALERALIAFRHNRDENMYKLQTCLALLATDFTDFLPKELDAMYDDLTTGAEADRQIEFGRVSKWVAETLQKNNRR